MSIQVYLYISNVHLRILHRFRHMISGHVNKIFQICLMLYYYSENNIIGCYKMRVGKMARKYVQRI